MAVGDGNIRRITEKLKEAADEEKVVFRLVVYTDGTMDWKTPHTADPLMNELLARGWLDKLREVVLAAMQQPPSKIVT
jgi:hypothetical protein